MTDPRKPGLWLDTAIPGFAARIAQLDLSNEHDADMLEVSLPPEAFVPDNGPRIWRLSKREEVIDHARKVFGLWRPNHEGVYVLEAPSLVVLGEVLNSTGAMLEQVVAAGEVVVALAPTGTLDFGFRSLRARVIAECMAALTGSQRFTVCRRCGGKFVVERLGATYCSRRCQSAHQRAQKEAQ